MTISWTRVHQDFKLNPTWCRLLRTCMAMYYPDTIKALHDCGHPWHGISTHARCFWDWNRWFVLRGSVKDLDFSPNPYSSQFIFISAYSSHFSFMQAFATHQSLLWLLWLYVFTGVWLCDLSSFPETESLFQSLISTRCKPEVPRMSGSVQE